MKKNYRVAKLEILGGQAKPGAALSSLGINMVQFANEFNAKTKEKQGEVCPVVIKIMPNKSFTFEVKTTPTAILLKKALNIEKGSANSKTAKVGTIPMSKIEEIAKYKLIDSNAYEFEKMKLMIIGTAKQMGINISD